MSRIFTLATTAIVILLTLFLMFNFLEEFISPFENVGQPIDENLIQEAETDATEMDEETLAATVTGLYVAFVVIVLIAGFSDSIGHAVILFANRVKPSRFAVTILFNTVLFVFGYLIWTLMVALVSGILFEREGALILAAIAVGISYIPLIYSFLVALPYVGVLISNILHGLVGIVLVLSLIIFFQYDLAEALLCAVVSFAAVIIFRLTIGRPFSWLGGRLLSAVAGTKVIDNMDEALRMIDKQGKVV